MIFDAFPPQMLDFLAENHLRNSKAWYEEHKDVCRKLVIEPYYALIEAMAPVMTKIDANFVTIPSKALSRVRRDTRFSKNKDLYRDHMWIVFRRPRQSLGSSLCYYFEIEQESWGYGVGYYNIPSAVREEYRQMVLHHDATYREARQALEQSTFALYGDAYKRPPFPDAPEKDQSWLNRKNIGASFSSTDYTALFNGTFYDTMMSDLKQIAPFYRFLRKAEERIAP